MRVFAICWGALALLVGACWVPWEGLGCRLGFHRWDPVRRSSHLAMYRTCHRCGVTEIGYGNGWFRFPKKENR